MSEIIFSMLLYFVAWIFFAITGAGSLGCFVIISKATPDDVAEFVDGLHFPFRQVASGFYKKPLEISGRFIFSFTVRGYFLESLFGSLMPSLFVLSLVINLLKYPHTLPERMMLVSEIIIYLVTLVIMWRFGSKLLKTAKGK